MADLFGFKIIEFQKDSTSVTPSYAVGYHKVELSGKEKYIVLLALRGTNLDLNGPNDLINDINSQVVGMGFRYGTENINNALKKCIRKIGCTKENTILFITGHSLGGGIAHSLAPFAENYTSTADNCFIYTYAATNAFIDILHYGAYDNVHNIINNQDCVPRTPLFYGKYGHKWYYDSADSKFKPFFDKIYQEKNWSGNMFDAHDTRTYLGMMLCCLPEQMGSGAENNYSITSIHCPVDIEVRSTNGTLMGKTVGDAITLEDTSKVMILTNNGEKEVIAPPGLNYTVSIVGTGDGQMTVSHKTVDSYNDEVVEEKHFADVPVATNKQFELVIDSNNSSEINLVDIDSNAPLERTSETVSANTDDKKTNFLYYIISGLVAILLIMIIWVIKIKRQKR